MTDPWFQWMPFCIFLKRKKSFKILIWNLSNLVNVPSQSWRARVLCHAEPHACLSVRKAVGRRWASLLLCPVHWEHLQCSLHCLLDCRSGSNTFSSRTTTRSHASVRPARVHMTPSLPHATMRELIGSVWGATRRYSMRSRLTSFSSSALQWTPAKAQLQLLLQPPRAEEASPTVELPELLVVFFLFFYFLLSVFSDGTAAASTSCTNGS